MSDMFVRERTAICAAMVAHGCKDVSMAYPFDVLYVQCVYFNCSVAGHCRFSVAGQEGRLKRCRNFDPVYTQKRYHEHSVI